MSSLTETTLQRARWTFTLNNYALHFDYKSHLIKTEFRVFRADWGYEVGENGTPHLQGYLELQRSLRRAYVLKILPNAHWEGAKESSLVNYAYCVKGGQFYTIGNFSHEENGVARQQQPTKTSLSVLLVVNGLLHPETNMQIKLSKEYAERHSYFDKIHNQLSLIRQQHKLFKRFKKTKLYPWQFEVLNMLFIQNDRQVLWIVDQRGDSGKTFMALYLCAVYGFKIFDGTITTRDIAHLIKGNEKGYCFDVSRDSIHSFSYSTLEAIKNGYVATGKYSGKICMFSPLPTVIFANDYPDMSKLSQDRWCVHTLGMGVFTDLSKHSILDPSDRYPFVEPTPFPNFSENFDHRKFLLQHFSITRSSSLPIPEQSTTNSNTVGNIHQSQVPGVSRITNRNECGFEAGFDSGPNRATPERTQDISPLDTTKATPAPAIVQPAICRIHGNGKSKIYFYLM